VPGGCRGCRCCCKKVGALKTSREIGGRKWLALGILPALGLFLAWNQSGITGYLERILLSYLCSVDELPRGKTFDAVYILGGGQERLRAKYNTAGGLYSEGRFKDIYILSRPGITEYSRLLGKNLTNDEWSLMTLENLGVAKQAVTPLTLRAGFFGTLSEAGGVSEVMRNKGGSSLLLITCPYHTARVRASFSHVLKKTDIEVSVIGSRPTEQAHLLELARELLKLQFYRVFLLY